jgi:hypothetical protein
MNLPMCVETCEGLKQSATLVTLHIPLAGVSSEMHLQSSEENFVANVALVMPPAVDFHDSEAFQRILVTSPMLLPPARIIVVIQMHSLLVLPLCPLHAAVIVIGLARVRILVHVGSFVVLLLVNVNGGEIKVFHLYLRFDVDGGCDGVLVKLQHLALDLLNNHLMLVNLVEFYEAVLANVSVLNLILCVINCDECFWKL